MDFLIKIALMLVAVSSVAAGAIFALFPKKTIEVQIAIYRLINWRMEPISWEKEVRNTRLMGFVAIAAGIATLGIVLIQGGANAWIPPLEGTR